MESPGKRNLGTRSSNESSFSSLLSDRGAEPREPCASRRSKGANRWTKGKGSDRWGSVVGSGREHNVSHSARSCIFYDMASNLTSRARHNSRPCAGRAWPGPRHPPTFAMIATGTLVCVYASTRGTRKNRMKDSSYTRAHAPSGQVRARPTASKPLEAWTVRKYYDRFSFFSYLLGRFVSFVTFLIKKKKE